MELCFLIIQSTGISRRHLVMRKHLRLEVSSMALLVCLMELVIICI